MKKKLLLILNIAIIGLSLWLYLKNAAEFNEVESVYDKIEGGFKNIDNAYFHSLTDANRYVDRSASHRFLQGIENDTLKEFIIKQRSVGRYYVEYQEAIQDEVFEIAHGISLQKRIQRIFLIIIIITCLSNVVIGMLKSR
jgi:hypothetical protein